MCQVFPPLYRPFLFPKTDSWCTVSPRLSWPLHLVNQLTAEALSALACQIETLLWLARGRLPSPSANTGLDSYHVSSHYRQIRAPGRQWDESGRGMERRGPEERPSITLWPPGPLTATPLKHSPIRLGWRQKPATPRRGSEQPDKGQNRQEWRDEKRERGRARQQV